LKAGFLQLVDSGSQSLIYVVVCALFLGWISQFNSAPTAHPSSLLHLIHILWLFILFQYDTIRRCIYVCVYLESRRVRIGHLTYRAIYAAAVVKLYICYLCVLCVLRVANEVSALSCDC